jgi:hypothetical protein
MLKLYKRQQSFIIPQDDAAEGQVELRVQLMHQ